MFILEIIPTTPGVPCGYGVSAPQETKCIYKYDEFQHIVGCRSLVHLQHCGNIVLSMLPNALLS